MTIEELQIIISAKTESVHAKIDRLKEKIASMQPKKAADVNVTTGKAQGNLKKLQAEIDRTQAKIDKLNAKMAGVYAKQDTIAGKYSDVPNLTGMSHDQTLDFMVGQDPQIRALNAQLDQLEAETAPLKAHLAETKAQIEAVGDASATTAVKTGGLSERVKTAGERMGQAGSRAGYFGRMVKSMLLSMVLYRSVSFVVQSISEGIQNMALGSAQANNTMSQLATSTLYLKNSIAASLMPALQAVTPIINQVADALANVFNTIAMLSARIFNHSQTAVIAQRANVNYAETLSGVGDKAGEAAKQVKELQRTVMGFDELNLLSKPLDNTGAGAGAGGAAGKPGMPSYGSMFKTVQVPDWVEKIGEVTDKVKKMIENNLNSIKRLLRMAPLVIGAVLAFSGANIPLGIGLMAIGAIEMGKQIKEDWNYLTNKTTSSLDKVKRMLAIAGAVELALGAVFAFSGANVPLGIGLMIGGVATTAAALDWDNLGNQLKTTIGGISFASGEAMLVLGAVLAFSGANVPLGVGLIIGGATTLASAVALNWDYMDNQLKITVSTVGAYIGSALLVLGTALTFSGANLPLGIGLMAAGAVNLAAVAVINWNSMPQQVKATLANILQITSAAMVAVGIILCLTGAGIPMGVGLIAAGLLGTIKAPSVSSTPITNWVRDIMNGIISIVETGVNWIISKLNKISFTVPDWVAGIGGRTFGININPIYIPRVVASAQHPQQGSGSNRNAYSFASGALVTGPVPAIVGEGIDHEAVLPLNDDVYSRIGKGISKNNGQNNNLGNDADRIIERMDKMEKTLENLKVYLYTTDRKIAESANRGNASIDRRYHTIAQT